MGSMSIVHWMIVIGVVVLLFGRNKISGLMGDVAQGIKSFKKGMQEDEPTSAGLGENKPNAVGAGPSLLQPTSSPLKDRDSATI
jgi:sec-independent protein translocase protein TatA